MNKRIAPKHQRLVLVVVAMAALIGASILAIWAIRNQASYFYVPSEFVAEPPEAGQAVRLGGMVQAGSLVTAQDGVTVDFLLGDGESTVPVRYSGILPDLFAEGSGAVAEGRLGPDGIFIADNILAKHDENYMPRELENMTAAQAQQVVAETQ